jgi:hypothetical protein
MITSTPRLQSALNFFLNGILICLGCSQIFYYFILILHIIQVQMNSNRVSGITQNNNLRNLTYITNRTSKKLKVLTLFCQGFLDFLQLHVQSPSSRAEFDLSCHGKKKCGSYQHQSLQCSLTLTIIFYKQGILKSLALRGYVASFYLEVKCIST